MKNNNYVLSCIDGSNYSAAVCDYAAWIANTVSAPLTLLHNIEQQPRAAVADLTGSIGLGSQQELLEELTTIEQQRSKLLMQKGKIMLQAAADRALAAGVESPEMCQRHGSLQESLIELEAEIRVLVMGVRGEEHRDGQLGAHLETVIRSLHRPVLVVNSEFSAPKKIMLAYDGQDAARKALAMVAESTLFKNIPCHLVYVGDSAEAQSVLAEGSAVLAAAGIEHESVQLSGKIVKALCDYQVAQGIDMTVMGAYSHNRLRDMLLGSFTAKMLQKTNRPLLLLR